MPKTVNGLDEARAALRACKTSSSPPAGEPKLQRSFGGGATALTNNARQMRKKPTPWESKLWRLLQKEQLENYKFRRQVPIDHYIADFVNYEKRLIIELDGSQHVASQNDKIRTAYLKAQGFTILRFWNQELDVDPEAVCMRILDTLRHTPHRNAKARFDSPAGGELKKEASHIDEGIIQLESPPFAACHAGVNYYKHLLAQLRVEFPETPFTFTLCCGDDAAIAHDALRMGFERVRIDCSDEIYRQLSAIAEETGVVVIQNCHPVE